MGIEHERRTPVAPAGNLIGAKDAALICGCSKTTFWLRRRAGRYPEPVTMVGNRPVFDRAAIEAAAAKENS
jgi:predicted DNA-binding transcriptional regulator AlpA